MLQKFQYYKRISVDPELKIHIKKFFVGSFVNISHQSY